MEKVRKWEEADVQEINQNKRKLCVKCRYSGITGTSVEKNNVAALTCDYILMEERSRNCSPINCKRFVPKGTGRRVWGKVKE